jgi:hypothetical protein
MSHAQNPNWAFVVPASQRTSAIGDRSIRMAWLISVNRYLLRPKGTCAATPLPQAMC